MFNHSHTILLITRQVLARIDLRGNSRLNVKQIWTAPSCDYNTILPEVSRAIQLGNRRPGKVTVVSPEFWTGMLSIPSDVAAIASVHEINQALALEAEVDSGLSAFDSRTNVMRIVDDNDRGGDCQWCVTQVPASLVHELSRTLRAVGTKLHGVGHPIAAQLMSSATISVETVQVLLDSWQDQSTFVADDVQQLATAWAACLSQTPPHPMVIMGESNAATNKQPFALTASLAILAAGGCGLWHWQTKQCLAIATQAIERLEKQQSQHEETEAALKTAETSVIQLRKEVTKAHAVRQAAERQLQLAGAVHSLNSRRWLALVDALAESANQNCWVQKLESDSVQTTVHGLALDHAAANNFAGRLELALHGSGWTTSPAATNVSPHKLVAFTIVLKATLKSDEPTSKPAISLNPSLTAAPNELAGVLAP